MSNTFEFDLVQDAVLTLGSANVESDGLKGGLQSSDKDGAKGTQVSCIFKKEWSTEMKTKFLDSCISAIITSFGPDTTDEAEADILRKAMQMLVSVNYELPGAMSHLKLGEQRHQPRYGEVDYYETAAQRAASRITNQMKSMVWYKSDMIIQRQNNTGAGQREQVEEDMKPLVEMSTAIVTGWLTHHGQVWEGWTESGDFVPYSCKETSAKGRSLTSYLPPKMAYLVSGLASTAWGHSFRKHATRTMCLDEMHDDLTRSVQDMVKGTATAEGRKYKNYLVSVPVDKMDTILGTEDRINEIKAYYDLGGLSKQDRAMLDWWLFGSISNDSNNRRRHQWSTTMTYQAVAEMLYGKTYEKNGKVVLEPCTPTQYQVRALPGKIETALGKIREGVRNSKDKTLVAMYFGNDFVDYDGELPSETLKRRLKMIRERQIREYQECIANLEAGKHRPERYQTTETCVKDGTELVRNGIVTLTDEQFRTIGLATQLPKAPFIPQPEMTVEQWEKAVALSEAAQGSFLNAPPTRMERIKKLIIPADEHEWQWADEAND